MSARPTPEKPDLSRIGQWQAACLYQLERKQPELALHLAQDLVAYAERTCRATQPLSLAVAYGLLAEVRLTLGERAEAKTLLDRR